MERLKEYRIPLLVVLGVLVVGIVVYLAWISPEGSKLSKLQAKQSKLQAEESALRAELGTLKREKANLAPTCTALARAVTAVPATPDVDGFLREVTQLAVVSGDPNTPSISVTQTTGSTKTAPPEGVTPVAVTLTLTGNYGQMSAFLKGLYTFPRLFTISTASIGQGAGSSASAAPAPAQAASPAAPPVVPAPAAGTGPYTLTMNGNIYYSAGQQNACVSPG